MYLRIFKICVLKYELRPVCFLAALELVWQAALKSLLIDIVMLLMVEKGFRVRIWHTIHRYAKAKNKFTSLIMECK